MLGNGILSGLTDQNRRKDSQGIVYTQILHVNLIQHVDVKGGAVGRAAKRHEYPKPLGVERIATSSELRTSYSDVVQLIVVSLAADRDDRVANETVTVGRGLVQLSRPLRLDFAAPSRTGEDIHHELRVVNMARRRRLQRAVESSPDLRISVAERLHPVRFRL